MNKYRNMTKTLCVSSMIHIFFKYKQNNATEYDRTKLRRYQTYLNNYSYSFCENKIECDNESNIKDDRTNLGQRDYLNELTDDWEYPEASCNDNESTYDSCKLNGTNQIEKEDTLDEEMKKFIEDILKKHKIVIFMKGTALSPYCKYSKRMIHILKLNRAKEIHTVNIMGNEELKKSMKVYSQWSTFPQLYINKKFIGGIDKVQDLHNTNELKELLGVFGEKEKK